MYVSFSCVLVELVSRGIVRDAARAHACLRMGYPAWLVLEELGREEASRVLSQASGIPVLGPDDRRCGWVDVQLASRYGIASLKARRWAPLLDGSIAVADPFGPLPDGALSGRQLYVAPADWIDCILRTAFPKPVPEPRQSRRLGRLLLESGGLEVLDLAGALDEQRRSGGRLGEIVTTKGLVDTSALTDALATQFGVARVETPASPVPLLSSEKARLWRAVALSDGTREASETADSTIPVAFADPTPEVIQAVGDWLQHSVRPAIVDEETLDALLAKTYGEEDVVGVTDHLRENDPDLSAYRNIISMPQGLALAIIVIPLMLGLLLKPLDTVAITVALCSVLYVLFAIHRASVMWDGWTGETSISPSTDDLECIDEHELPIYTILLPVYREKSSTLQSLFDGLSALDYPRHKLDVLLLLEVDDEQTHTALVEIGKPSWIRTLRVPALGPRTKPKAISYGLLYARGKFLTVYDAEDRPEPDQLKKAAWALQRLPESVACLQAKLNYYNSRQNLLTRWFTLEYSSWFDLFLPGLHRSGAPIPLGGTSNHFRTTILKEHLSWDPYNVTEDADLGIRLTRLGNTVMMLDSTTYEEANSRMGNWIRQRSRWIKGYMQTFLVHTRHPVTLYRQIGLKASLHFLAVFGGMIYTVFLSPMFWALLVLWFLGRPAWMLEVFPALAHYSALVSLVLGNFFFVYLSLLGAAGRAEDDLAPYALLVPIYWLLISVAAYKALYELIARPHYWHKTEHGLHLQNGPVKRSDRSTEIASDGSVTKAA